MSNFHDFESRVLGAWPAQQWCDVHVVLAVSAGPDSVAMLRAVLALKKHTGGNGRLCVAHLNHGIRGASGGDDQDWLAALCDRLEIPLEVGYVDVPALAAMRGDGLEAAAREARHSFVRETAERIGARFVAMAHTADDQVETIFHRVIRGTGLAGLAGMAEARPLSPSVSLVRPLLHVCRREVLAYLSDIMQDFRIDPTNVDPRFTRNRLRHDVLPLLRAQYNPDVDAALVRLASQAGEAQRVLADLAEQLVSQCVTANARRIQIDCGRLHAQPALLIRQVCKSSWVHAGWPLQAMGYQEWQQLAELICHGGPPLNLPGDIRAERDGDRLVLSMPAR